MCDTTQVYDPDDLEVGEREPRRAFLQDGGVTPSAGVSTGEYEYQTGRPLVWPQGR